MDSRSCQPSKKVFLTDGGSRVRQTRSRNRSPGRGPGCSADRFAQVRTGVEAEQGQDGVLTRRLLCGFGLGVDDQVRSRRPVGILGRLNQVSRRQPATTPCPALPETSKTDGQIVGVGRRRRNRTWGVERA
jgi:hypothetical protein